MRRVGSGMPAASSYTNFCMGQPMGGKLLDLISYSDLASLRLRDFIPGADLWVEESGMQVVVGLGGFERHGETSFGWRQGEPYHTAEVTLDLGPATALPDEVIQRIIKEPKLPVSKGMLAPDLIKTFGKPQVDEKTGPRRFLRFAVGDKEPYLVGCGVDERNGLVHLFLARKDYVDEEEAL